MIKKPQPLSIYYRLNEDNKAIPCSLLEWSDYIKSPVLSRIVKQEQILDHMVSTVFLGINHNFFDDGKSPHIFETMIFPKETLSDIYCERYSTWEQAEKGHQKAIEWLKKEMEK